jgi:pimeloyl-ACP methyl ester carboxylesterase
MIRAVVARQRRRPPDPIFDRSGVVSKPCWRDAAGDIGALAFELARFGGRLIVPAGLPRGDGHPVLVIPGLFSSDWLIRGFREALTMLGYQVEGWGAGLNFGPTKSAWDTASETLSDMAAQSGQRVSLVGHSLGGVLARALAAAQPELVQQVITVCSPFRLPTASRWRLLYRALSHWHIDDAILTSRLAVPPPVRTTAIYSPRDGIVAWQSCIDEPAPGRENIAIEGRHSTMLGNPATLRIVADRLARPDPAGES